MKAVVQDEGIWKPSVSKQGQNRRVTFKMIEGELANKYVYLNLTDYENYNNTPLVQHWASACKVGNMVDINVRPGTNQVNKFSNYTLLKEAKDGSQ